MPWFSTCYRANWIAIANFDETCRPGQYGAHLWAETFKQAKSVANHRGLGETVVGPYAGRKKPYRYAHEVLRATRGHNRGMYPKLHALSYLGMIGLASGALTLQEVLGDEGFIHDMCHAKSGDLAEITRRVVEAEKRVPGYLPNTDNIWWR
jgi:hypothetical protein